MALLSYTIVSRFFFEIRTTFWILNKKGGKGRCRLKSYKACGNHLRVRVAVTAATNHTNPKVVKVHAGKGAPTHKHASYDAYESYESEGQALEILLGLFFTLLLFVGAIVIVWGPGFVSSLGWMTF